MNTIEYGCTLYIDHDNIIITDEYEIMVKTIIDGEETFISIGVIEDEVTYFYNSRKPSPRDINQLIYMGDNIYTYKRTMKPIEEFNMQTEEIKTLIFDDLYYVLTKHH
jgi:hypothetical protein